MRAFPADLLTVSRTLMYTGIVTGNYSTAFFIPTILKQLGWTSLQAQYMSIPIYMFCIVTTLCCAQLSDRIRHRFGIIIGGCLVATAGYLILLRMQYVAVGVRYFATFLVTSGGYIAQPITVVWLNNNLSGHYKRGVGAAMQVGLGNVGGIIASNIFVQAQAPTYVAGFGTCLALVWLCVSCGTMMIFHLRRENRQRDRGLRDHLLELPDDEKDNLGDDHPSFRFTY